MTVTGQPIPVPKTLAVKSVYNYSLVFEPCSCCRYHSLRKPADFTGQVPPAWTAAVDGGSGTGGYFFDLGTMWDQYKACLPLMVSVYPEAGERLCQALLAMSCRFGDFPNGYTMDTATTRFDGQAIGLSHHVRDVTSDVSGAVVTLFKPSVTYPGTNYPCEK